MLSFFTEALGKISCLARGARRSSKRFSGALEAMHSVRLELEERTPNRFELRDARIERVRLHLTSNLAALDAAGRALGWVRGAMPERVNEPEIWGFTSGLLDSLDDPTSEHPDSTLAAFGLKLLGALGWGFDFERCVRCGNACPPNKASMIDPTRGGLVCSGCGGAALRIDAGTRARLNSASHAEPGALLTQDANVTLRLVEAALAAHAGVS